MSSATEAVSGREIVPRRALRTLSRFWAWLFLLGLVVFFSITGQGFFDLFNFQGIGANMAILLIMALGQTFVIITGGIDLSTGYVMGLASVAAALVMVRLGAEWRPAPRRAWSTGSSRRGCTSHHSSSRSGCWASPGAPASSSPADSR